MGLVILVEKGDYGHNLKQCGILKNTVNLKTRVLDQDHEPDCIFKTGS